MSIDELRVTEQELNDLVEEVDLASLEKRLNQFSIFEALRITEAEVKHSQFLSWLLNPQETHALGDDFQKVFLNFCEIQQCLSK
ncbi:MAG TPA: PD-(D/E)XK nuclease family protein [Nitrososphaerales archaeon]|nr:PD-(D/E)XK nuclease family protein [Nitrososphaerales archaeon]